jgi:hypothetical protein
VHQERGAFTRARPGRKTRFEGEDRAHSQSRRGRDFPRCGCCSLRDVSQAVHESPALTALVQPYSARLAAEGVSRIEVPGAAGGNLRVGTPYGFFEIPDQGNAPPAAFMVVSDDSARVLSDSYAPSDLEEYRAAIDRIVPGVLRVAPQNEAWMHQLQTASH